MKPAGPLTALFLCLTPVLGQEQGTTTETPATIRERFEELVARIETGTPQELGQAIAGLGSEVAPVVLEELALAPDDPALCAAVRALGRDAFLPVETPDAAPAAALLAVVAEVGDVRDLDLMLQLDGTEDACLEGALTSLLARDARTWEELFGASVQAEPRAACCVFRTVGQSGDERSAAWLGQMLVYDTGLDIVLLSQLQLAASQAHADENTRLQVRNRLWVVDDEQVLRKAIELTVDLDDDEALERLIGLLPHENEHVRSGAHRALCALGGISLPAEPAAWESWLNDERTWFEKRSEAVFRKLRGNDVPSILAAMREVARHRYERRALTNEVVPLVFHSDPAVHALACEVLRQIGVRDVVPELRLALEDEDADVVAAAVRALAVLGVVVEEETAGEEPEDLVAELQTPAVDE